MKLRESEKNKKNKKMRKNDLNSREIKRNPSLQS